MLTGLPGSTEILIAHPVLPEYAQADLLSFTFFFNFSVFLLLSIVKAIAVIRDFVGLTCSLNHWSSVRLFGGRVLLRHLKFMVNLAG